MAYYTWSQGFRPGGFNRTSTSLAGVVSLHKEAPFTAGSSATDQYNKPSGYNSDDLVNNEIGLKSQFLDHRLEFNASAYIMHWNNVQFTFFDPVHLGNTTFVPMARATRSRIRAAVCGPRHRRAHRAGIGLLEQLHSDDFACLQSNRPTATNPTPLGACITQINSAPYTNPFGTLDSRAAYSPPFEYNVRARYDFHVAEYKPFVSFGANYIGAMNNQPANYPPGGPGPATTTLELFRIPGTRPSMRRSV